MSKETEFVWTDALVKEFADNVPIDEMCNQEHIEQFKQSKLQDKGGGRIEVGGIYESYQYPKGATQYSFDMDKKIPLGKKYLINQAIEQALNEDTVVDSNVYQCYLRDCDCSSAGIILHNGKPVCRWCRKSYGKGGMINYLPEHFQSEKSDTVVEDKVVPETKTMGSLSTYTEGFQAGIYWNQKYGNEPIPKDFMEVVQKLNLHQPIPEKLTPTDNTQTVTDNSDVEALSINEVKIVLGGKIDNVDTTMLHRYLINKVRKNEQE